MILSTCRLIITDLCKTVLLQFKTEYRYRQIIIHTMRTQIYLGFIEVTDFKQQRLSYKCTTNRRRDWQMDGWTDRQLYIPLGHLRPLTYPGPCKNHWLQTAEGSTVPYIHSLCRSRTNTKCTVQKRLYCNKWMYRKSGYFCVDLFLRI